MTTYSVVTVTLEDRTDGGLRVFSEDLPGLLLSGPDKEDVCDRIAPAIQALLEHKGVRAVVYPSRPIPQVMAEPSPRALDMHAMQHELFVVVVANNNHIQSAHR